MANKKKIFRREYIPLVIAFLVLVLLIVALVFTIINKPKKDEKKDDKLYVVNVQDKTIPENTCSGEDYLALVEKANNIMATYEVNDKYYYWCGLEADGEQEEIDIPEDVDEESCPENYRSYGYALDVHLSDIPDNVRVEATNDQDNTIMTFYKDDVSDAYTWSEVNNNYLRVYTFKVYSTLESCNNVLIREFQMTLPRWNENAKNLLCYSDLYKDKEMCKPFIFDKFDMNKDRELLDKTIKEVEKKREEEQKQQENESKANKIIIVSVVAIAIVAVVGVVFVVMKGRKKNEKK